jgi:hypothetical protein
MQSGLITWVLILIAGELVFITLAVTIYLFLKKKPSASRPTASTSQSKPSTGVAGSSYWDQEISRTKKTLLTRNEKALEELENTDLLALNLRLQMLQLEQKNALTEADKRKIEVIEYDVTNILKRMNIIHALEMSKRKPGDRHEDEETKKLIEQQTQTIAFLKKYTRDILDKILKQNAEFLSSQQGPEDVARLSTAHNELIENSESLMRKIDHLEGQNKELTMCVAVLEEENQFLREQIATLLKLSNEAGK